MTDYADTSKPPRTYGYRCPCRDCPHCDRESVRRPHPDDGWAVCAWCRWVWAVPVGAMPGMCAQSVEHLSIMADFDADLADAQLAEVR